MPATFAMPRSPSASLTLAKFSGTSGNRSPNRASRFEANACAAGSVSKPKTRACAVRSKIASEYPPPPSVASTYTPSSRIAKRSIASKSMTGVWYAPDTIVRSLFGSVFNELRTIAARPIGVRTIAAIPSVLVLSVSTDHVLGHFFVGIFFGSDVLLEISRVPEFDVIEHADEEYFFLDLREIQERAGNQHTELRIELHLLAPLHQHAHEEAVLLARLRRRADDRFQTLPLVERIRVQAFFES